MITKICILVYLFTHYLNLNLWAGSSKIDTFIGLFKFKRNRKFCTISLRATHDPHPVRGAPLTGRPPSRAREGGLLTRDPWGAPSRAALTAPLTGRASFTREDSRACPVRAAGLVPWGQPGLSREGSRACEQARRPVRGAPKVFSSVQPVRVTLLFCPIFFQNIIQN